MFSLVVDHMPERVVFARERQLCLGELEPPRLALQSVHAAFDVDSRQAPDRVDVAALGTAAALAFRNVLACVVKAYQCHAALLDLDAGMSVEGEPGVVVILLALHVARDSVNDNCLSHMVISDGHELLAALLGVERRQGRERQVLEVDEVVGRVAHCL